MCARCLAEHAETVYRTEFQLYLCEKCYRVRTVMHEIFFGKKGMDDYKRSEMQAG